MSEGCKQAAGWHLGINLGHDRAAALVRDGEIAVAIQQERLDRNKYSLGMPLQSAPDPRSIQLPERAICYCLDECGIELSDLTSITANMPGIDHAPKILAGALSASLRDKIRQLPSHHLAHAYSTYWPSGFEQAIILVADAGGTTTDGHKTESYSLYQAQGNRIRLLHSEKVAAHLAGLSTLGFLYEYLTRTAGFVTPVGTDLTIPEPGKLMGLAPYGGAQYHWHPWIRLPEDGGYRLGISAYDIFLEVAALEKRYGAGRDDGQSPPHLHPWRVDLAYKVQRELEQALLYLVEQAVRQTGVKKLCLAGGVALNAVANYRLQQQLQLEAVFTFPAAGDAGIAAGCALWAYATGEKDLQRKRLHRATLGHSYSDQEIRNTLRAFTDRIEIKRLGAADSVEKTAQALAQGHIVARFQGGSEYGPRALGHRSILADPMRQLDRALFFGELEGAAWSLEELRELAATGGRYKETSRLFPDNPFGGPFQTRLARDTILLLDPLGYSQLVDVRGRQKPLACSMQEVRLLITLLDSAAADRLEALRREQQTTPSAWTRQISQGLEQLCKFGLKPRYHAPRPPADDRLPGHKEGAWTLAPFAEPHFYLGSRLEEIRIRLHPAPSSAGRNRGQLLCAHHPQPNPADPRPGQAVFPPTSAAAGTA